MDLFLIRTDRTVLLLSSEGLSWHNASELWPRGAVNSARKRESVPQIVPQFSGLRLRPGPSSSPRDGLQTVPFTVLLGGASR
jgi:hypothetical protein